MVEPTGSAWLDQFANLERRLDPAAWSTVRLERVHGLLAELGDPHRLVPTVHIAGSKGKGSVAAQVAAVLRAAGYRTGLYTSPHLTTPHERIRVDAEPIAAAVADRLVDDRLRPAAGRYLAASPTEELSWFDLHTALAFCHFAAAGCQWQVIEVGLGGRLDATNVVTPAVTAITTIALDHTQLLGSTLPEIAAEKAGIIKPGVPLVVAPQSQDVEGVLRTVAAERGAPLAVATGVAAGPRRLLRRADGRWAQDLLVDWPGEPAPIAIESPLLGAHQGLNAAVARAILEKLVSSGRAEIPVQALRDGLEQVDWPGRLQVLGERPWLVLDGAHNPAAACCLAASLAEFGTERVWLVVGSARDKDCAGLLANLAPRAAGCIACELPGRERMLTAGEVASLARRWPWRVETGGTVAAAVALAQSLAGPDDLICVTGSLYVVGEYLRLIGEEA